MDEGKDSEPVVCSLHSSRGLEYSELTQFPRSVRKDGSPERLVYGNFHVLSEAGL